MKTVTSPKSLSCNPETMSRQFYDDHAKKASENLMKFLSTVLPEKKICVMYFDEAHELGVLFWIFLRLVQHQVPRPETEPLLMEMWYTFMGTKSSVSFYAPRPSQCQSIASFSCTCLTAALVLSLSLRNERAHLLYPYIDLGFDQRVIAKSKSGQVSVLMRDMQTIQFLSQYGRPLYVDLACHKQQLFISLPGGVRCLKKHGAR
jgi:hypothetical protein